MNPEEVCGFTFEQVLPFLKQGRRCFRAGWNGKGMWIQIQVPDEHSKMQRPYFYIKTAQDQLVPWVASHGDLLGADWAVD